VQALRLMEWKSEPKLVDVPKPEAGPGQVVIKVGGSGACHSDIHLMQEFDAGVVPWNPPFTLGHENAGWVHELGEGVTHFEIGQPVAVYGPWGCGRCEHCLVGTETYCENPMEAPMPGGGGGLGIDGGMAEYMLIHDARFLIPLPNGLDPAHAAPLTDAGLTPYHAIRRSLRKLTPGSNAVVIGVGGLGHMGVQILNAITGANIIAVDQREAALTLALNCGADRAFEAGDDTATQIREVTGGKGADVVLDFVGSEDTMAMAAAAARFMGDVTIVGIAGGTFPFSFFSLPYEVSMQTTYWGTRPELVELLGIAADGRIGSEITTYSLPHATNAYGDLQAGKIEGRAVVVPFESA